MTRDKLEQIFFLRKEIRMWEEELENIHEMAQAKSKQITGMPFANTNEKKDPVAEIAMKAYEVKAKILELKKTLETERLNAIQWISEIEDPLIRTLVKYRCVDNLSWDEISNRIGYERTTCSKKYNEYMKSLGRG